VPLCGTSHAPITAARFAGRIRLASRLAMTSNARKLGRLTSRFWKATRGLKSGNRRTGPVLGSQAQTDVICSATPFSPALCRD